MKPLILVVLDGVSAKAAFARMGTMEALVEEKRAAVCTMQAALPTLSRPLYETIQTGLSPIKHGILRNDDVRPSAENHLFARVKEAGGITAAAAYHWIAELYDEGSRRFALEDEKSGGFIDRGIYYYTDDYPVSALFADADFLVDTYQPDYLLVHPMNADDAGHKYGGESREYLEAVALSDRELARYLPKWLSLGYTVAVTADHGMGPDGFHGGVAECERLVPLYLVGPGIPRKNERNTLLPQEDLAEILACLMGLHVEEKGEPLCAHL